MTIHVRAELIGTKLHRLLMFSDGKPIGEYERTQAADIDRKIEEIRAAESNLLALYKQHGELKVRWDGVRREKVIRTLGGQEVGVIPRSAWRRPSWER